MNCPGHCLMFEHRVRSYRGECIGSLYIFFSEIAIRGDSFLVKAHLRLRQSEKILK